MSTDQDWFTSDSDWAAYATQNGIALPRVEDRQALESLEATALDIKAGREAQSISQREWVRTHPLSAVGYESCHRTIQVRDEASIDIKISWPNRDLLQQRGPRLSDDQTKASLPVLFVTHGGGWIQGTHVSEEQWLLWPIYDQFNAIIVSVAYRLAPEHKFPTWIEDSWDVLEQILSNPDQFSPQPHITLDLHSVFLAGSSAGAIISAVLSHRCRDLGIQIRGVILNVPVLCDYRHLPYAELRALSENNDLSYEQCTTAALSSGIMKAVWDLAIPSATGGRDPLASPLLGRLDNLPPHLIYVAGQDPLRDEGLLYARRLKDQGVSVELEIYAGVPHVFAEMHELVATKRFWKDIKQHFSVMLASPVREDLEPRSTA